MKIVGNTKKNDSHALPLIVSEKVVYIQILLYSDIVVQFFLAYLMAV